MRFVRFKTSFEEGLAVRTQDGSYYGFSKSSDRYPGDLEELISRGTAALSEAAAELAQGRKIDLSVVEYLPPLARPGKIICVGLNYVDHSIESGFEPPAYPTVFVRFNSSLLGHAVPLVRPHVSVQFDYEGELVVVIGKGGRAIQKDMALSHVGGYSIFNDASVRDYQFKSPQWTMGKNFDNTGAFGPEFVTADELPQGARGLSIQTRLNGQVVQDASTDDMIFDVSSLIAILSEVMTLEAGDVIVSGTPSGVGLARKPPLWMKAGDVCEVEVEGLGILRNSVVDG